MLLNRDELYEKLETAILNLPKRTFLNYREPLNIRLYKKIKTLEKIRLSDKTIKK